MSAVFDVSRSGYYDWLDRPESARSQENARLSDRIKEIYAESRGSYGSPRIAASLAQEGHQASRPRVARLMRQIGLHARPKRQYVHTTDSKHALKVCDNHLNRNFSVGPINRAWVSDLTYLPTAQGWLYLTTVMDLGDRRVIGWATSETMHTQATTIPALQMAINTRKPTPGLIFHSDRGVQYADRDFRDLLAKSPNIIQSMSRKGNCWDNAPAESFFKSLKAEWMPKKPFKSREEARMAIFEYIEIWYNRKRLHSALGYQAPTQFSHQPQPLPKAA
jgi:transposase InsO family protein